MKLLKTIKRALRFILKGVPNQTITAQVIYGDGTNGSSVDFSIKEYSEKLPDEKDKKLADKTKNTNAFFKTFLLPKILFVVILNHSLFVIPSPYCIPLFSFVK